MELFYRLLEQFLDVRQDQHAAAPQVHGVLANGGHQGRLAAGGRNHHARVVIPPSQMAVDGFLGGFLVGSQC
jgi:hypothetical protein